MRAELAWAMALLMGCVACGGDDPAPGSGGAGGSGASGGSAGGNTGGAGGAETTRVKQIAAGAEHNCVILDDASVTCWGSNSHGQLGLGHRNNVGDDELATDAGVVDVGGPVVQLSLGQTHTCALLEGGRVRCWGGNSNGQLGYDHTDTIGDDEAPATAGDVDVGGTAIAVSAGRDHSCALLTGGTMRCWGASANGELGYGSTDPVMGNPALAGDVDVGGSVTAIRASYFRTCALVGGSLRCWGGNATGQLGLGNVLNVGDDEVPSSVAALDLGGEVESWAMAPAHTCAQLSSGNVRCWGGGTEGSLGTGSRDAIGDDELPTSVAALELPGSVIQVAVGFHSCALTEAGDVYCWGRADRGELGGGSTSSIDRADTAPKVPVGGAATALVAGLGHSCVLLAGGVRCWGTNEAGQLGLGHTDRIGDDEAANSAGLLRF